MTEFVLVREMSTVQFYSYVGPEFYVGYLNEDETSETVLSVVTGESSVYVCFSPAEGTYSPFNLISTAADWAKFKALVDQWHEERGSTSSTTKIVMCPSYQKIIGMGEKALPFIFGDMAENHNRPDHWFWALSMITGADPIPVEIYGQHRAMSKVWLSWAEEKSVFTGGRRQTSPISTAVTVH
jgi:hypothetical protein